MTFHKDFDSNENVILINSCLINCNQMYNLLIFNNIENLNLTM